VGVTKHEVEELLGAEITDEQFNEALESAKRKQEYIFKLEGRPVVLQSWYLAILTKEYVGQYAFSRFTMDLCETLRNMEKECPVKDQDTLTDNHIVAQPIA
jgi:benzoyl-CoA reductase/2-hydroxyglutaryl-CoA dehydratase subunit BcrC/BadD/HgdB